MSSVDVLAAWIEEILAKHPDNPKAAARAIADEIAVGFMASEEPD